MEISSSVGAKSLQNGGVTIKAVSPGRTWFKSNCLSSQPLQKLEPNGRNRIRLFGGFVVRIWGLAEEGMHKKVPE